MPAYVLMIKGIPYHYIKVLSLFELKRSLRKAGFAEYRILLPTIGEKERKHFSLGEKACVSFYEVLKRIPFLCWGLYLFVPFFQVLGFAHREATPKELCK